MTELRPGEDELSEQMGEALRALVSTAPHGSATDVVTDALREAILSGALPPGTWLREDQVSKIFQMSRTPVREALRRLSDEELTVRAANRGTVVAELTMREILSVYEVRAALEGLAAKLAAGNANESDIEPMRAVLAAMEKPGVPPEQLSQLNLQFHRHIREAARNPVLDRMLLQVERAVRRFGESTFEKPNRVLTANEEHTELLQAISERRAEDAERIAVRHMERAREIRIDRMLDS